MRILGFMTGTSMDGVDAAVIETDGEQVTRRLGWSSEPFAPDLAAALREAARTKPPFDRADWDADLVRLSRRVSEAHVAVGSALLDRLGAPTLDAVGFHGQTLRHQPPADGAPGRTLQIGEAAPLAEAFGAPVVHDFRARDMAAGGEGAPFAPAYHRALVREAGFEGATCVLNLGGVGNLTFIHGETILAFDTGPGAGLIDDWTRAATGAAYDEDGRLALAGRVDEARVAAFLRRAYFEKTGPKSLDRADFTHQIAEGLSVEDGAATLAALTAACVSKAATHLPSAPKRWVVVGGGRRHPGIMRELRARLAAPVVSAEDAGWAGDAVEAEAFAFLAARTLTGSPSSWPETTGAAEPVVAGEIARPPRMAA